jgi:hypothetical protein
MSNRLTFKPVDVPAGGAWWLDKSEVEITYPGYDERIKALAAFHTKFEKNPPSKVSSTSGHFTYSPSDNLLSFVPSKS